MLLAGDVGGTKTSVGLYERGRPRPSPVELRTYRTVDYDSLEAIVEAFYRDSPAAAGHGLKAVECACFGVAGPIVDRAAQLVNVPWAVDAAAIERAFDIPRVQLLNDLAALATAVPLLEPHELDVLQPGRRVPTGNAAVIAAGTGLGQALLHNINGRFVPSPTEAGHADFAARTPREIELLQELLRAYGRADCERVISGPGLVNLFQFTHRIDPCSGIDPSTVRADLAKVVSSSAMEGRCRACQEALDMFVTSYGAEAGNLALRTVATAGVFLGGGIAPKILPALHNGLFLEAFQAKPPMNDLLRNIPIWVILNTNAGVLGAAVAASELP